MLCVYGVYMVGIFSSRLIRKP